MRRGWLRNLGAGACSVPSPWVRPVYSQPDVSNHSTMGGRVSLVESPVQLWNATIEKIHPPELPGIAEKDPVEEPPFTYDVLVALL